MLPVCRASNLARVLDRLQKELGVWVFGTADDAERSLFEIDLTGPAALAFGSEGRGLKRLTRACCDDLARIPTVGRIDSLNVSVAVGIGLFEAVRQRQGKGVS